MRKEWPKILRKGVASSSSSRLLTPGTRGRRRLSQCGNHLWETWFDKFAPLSAKLLVHIEQKNRGGPRWQTVRGKRRTFSPVTRNGRPKLVNVRQHLSDCCPVFLTSSPFPSFVKIISSIPRRKGGKGTVLGDREVYIKYRRKLIATKCSTFEMIFLTQRHRSRAISEKCNKILHKIILSLSLWAINASPFGERQLSERRQSYEWNVEA